MPNNILTPVGWSYWTGMAHDLRPDSRFLTKVLLGGTSLGSSKVKGSPIPEIKYDFYRMPQEAAPLRSFHDENVKVSIMDHREQRMALVPLMGMEDDVDIRESFDMIPPPMEDLRASAQKLSSMTKGQVREKLIEMKNMIHRRIEVFLGQIIATGGINYQDDMFTFAHDFELAEQFFFDTTTAWDAEGADPLADLRIWKNNFAKMNGTKPGIILCGENVADQLAYNTALIAKFNLEPANLAFGEMKPKWSEQEMVEHMVRVRGIGDIYSYMGMYDDRGVRTRYLDPDRIYFINTESFKLYYGAIYSTLFGGNPIQIRDYFSYVEPKPNHKGYKVMLESKPLPIVEHPYAIMSVKVLNT